MATTGTIEQPAQGLGADRFAGQVRHQHQCHVTDGGIEVVEDGTLLTDAFGIPVESRMVGQTAILIVLVLHQKLIDEQLFDPDPMSANDPSVRTASAATTRSESAPGGH